MCWMSVFFICESVWWKCDDEVVDDKNNNSNNRHRHEYIFVWLYLGFVGAFLFLFICFCFFSTRFILFICVCCVFVWEKQSKVISLSKHWVFLQLSHIYIFSHTRTHTQRCIWRIRAFVYSTTNQHNKNEMSENK